MAGGGTLAGGLIGRALARGTKGGRIRSGRFYKDEAKDLIKSIGSNIWSSALKSGVKGGLGALAKGFSFGKEGLKFTSGAEGAGVNPADLLGKDVPAAAGGYSDSLWGKFGEAIDYKGSFVGKGLQKLKTAQLGKEFADAGWIDPNLQTRVGGEPIVAMDRLAHSPIEKSARIDQMLQERGPFISPPGFDDVMSSGSGGRGFQKGILPGHSKVQYDIAQAKSAELAEALKGHQFGDAPENITKGYFSEDDLYDWSGDLADSSWQSGGERISAYELQKKKDTIMSKLAYDNPYRPNVPADIETDFVDEAIPDAVHPGFSEFDEASWAEGEDRLAVVRGRPRKQAEARYLHAGRGENVWDIFDKGDYQSTMYPFDTSDIGTGLSAADEQLANKLATQGSGTSFGLSPSNYNLVGDKYRNRFDSLRWQNRLFGD